MTTLNNKQRNGARRFGRVPGTGTRLARKAFPANLGDALRRDRTERDALRAAADFLQHDIAASPGRPDPDPETGDTGVPDCILPLARVEACD